jgi:excisionase family DNA binding protein
VIVTGLLLTPEDCSWLSGVLAEGCRVLGAEAFTSEQLIVLGEIADAGSHAGEQETAENDVSCQNRGYELTTAEAAAVLGLTSRQVRRLIEAGRLPHGVVRGHYRLRRADVESLT